MRILYRAFKFGVILRAYKKRMVANLHDLYQAGFRIGAACDHSVLFVRLKEPVIEFIAMPMPFIYLTSVINAVSQRAWPHCAGI